jgi:hypothetical protein
MGDAMIRPIHSCFNMSHVVDRNLGAAFHQSTQPVSVITFVFFPQNQQKHKFYYNVAFINQLYLIVKCDEGGKRRPWVVCIPPSFKTKGVIDECELNSL